MSTLWIGTVSRLALLVAALSFISTAASQGYPSKPIRIINPWPAGGPADAIARPVMDRVSKAFGQPIFFDVKSGANGMVGTEYVSKNAAPDGYTLLLTHAGPIAISPAVQKEMSYRPVQDFEHITILATPTTVLVINPALPFKNVPELIAYAQNNPGKLAYGSTGLGSTTHLAAELLALMANVKFLHVPYRGASPVMQDLLGGQLQFAFIGYSAADPFIKAGTLRPIAISSSTSRSPVSPDLPALHEILPGFEINTWFAIAAPARTPKDIIKKLQTEIAKVLKEPAIIDLLAATGSEPGGMAPEVFVKKIESDIEQNTKLVLAIGMEKQ
jgi:tripartite-type tricarboxylate transporter receptor subunit TctC